MPYLVEVEDETVLESALYLFWVQRTVCRLGYAGEQPGPWGRRGRECGVQT